jgi:hypothetical protein
MARHHVCLAVAALLLWAAPAAADSTTVLPQNVEYWTGFAEYNIGHSPVYTRWDGYVTWAFYPHIDDARDRGWAKFDLSAIPDTAVIATASLRLFIDFQTSAKPLDLRLVSSDPVPASAQTIYTEAGSGAIAGSLGSTAPDWNVVTLNATGIAALQAALAQDWLALGWDYPGTEYAILEAHGRQHQNPPRIIVTWGMTGVGEHRSAPRAPDRLPTIVRGVLNLGVVSRQNTAHRVELLNAAGRKVLDLHPGANDVSCLAPGVYFVRPASSVERDASGITKVVLQK